MDYVVLYSDDTGEFVKDRRGYTPHVHEAALFEMESQAEKFADEYFPDESFSMLYYMPIRHR